MISPIFLVINLVVVALIAIAGVFACKFIGRRVSKKLSIRLIALYTLALLLSPIMAGFIGQDVNERKDPIEVPPYHFEKVLEDYENLNLEDLQEDEFLHQLAVTEISGDANDFPKGSSLMIRSSQFAYNHLNNLIIEVTDAVDSIVITQFNQRFIVDNLDITQEFNSWDWTIKNQELRAEIPQTKIQFNNLSPSSLAFHFDKELSKSIQDSFNFGFIPYENTIQWIQIPEGMDFQHRGNGPWRIKD